MHFPNKKDISALAVAASRWRRTWWTSIISLRNQWIIM